MVSYIARVAYESCGNTLLQAINNVATQYQSVLNTASGGDGTRTRTRTGNDNGGGNVNGIDSGSGNRIVSQELEMRITVEEVQLAWLIYSAGAFLSARQPYRSPVEDEDIDAQLIATVIKLDNLYMIRLATVPMQLPEQMDLALIMFYQSYRSAYLGDSPQKLARLFGNLSLQLGEVTIERCLDIMIQLVGVAIRNVSWLCDCSADSQVGKHEVAVGQPFRPFTSLSQLYKKLQAEIEILCLAMSDAVGI
ncbi:Exportin-7 [Zancudomyces culisetae]|uniref:Exportin-7 n=1 Tax=Zancudomyces culisetae TaxID=1213189 RepID=A0A1R1PWJ3_ZANCU|nr:Exportin-7 [Zancudomyces culisetae]|eukprot:OMH85366.1 Exportin-7 [Zancudomyces culisetae]